MEEEGSFQEGEMECRTIKEQWRITLQEVLSGVGGGRAGERTEQKGGIINTEGHLKKPYGNLTTVEAS